MGLFNNLVIYDQSVNRNTFESIGPGWRRPGPSVRRAAGDVLPAAGRQWRDGGALPPTCAALRPPDGEGRAKLRHNPQHRFENVEQVTADNDSQVTFHLKQPQPSLLAFLAAGWSAVYHAMFRRRRCGGIRSAPALQVRRAEKQRTRAGGKTATTGSRGGYLDAIEYSIIGNRATRMLALPRDATT
jgi:peptide/nickel transport system substrate-binding protein